MSKLEAQVGAKLESCRRKGPDGVATPPGMHASAAGGGATTACLGLSGLPPRDGILVFVILNGTGALRAGEQK